MSYQYKNFSELDFDTIKRSFIDFLKNQDTFKDYNFEGSAMSQLMNLLAYNTQYNAFYLNMHASERFLATAQRRENVVNLAKNLGYVPSSGKGSTVDIDIKALRDINGPDSIVFEKNTTFFKASNDSDSFTFYVDESVIVPFNTSENAYITATDISTRFAPKIKLFEGKKFIQNFTITSNNDGVILSNSGVQHDKIYVEVTSGSVTETYLKYDADTFTELTGSSTVFFIEETIGQRTRIYFGDNIKGKRPTDNSTITVTYFTTKGTSGNLSSGFNLAGKIVGVKSLEVLNLGGTSQTISRSSDGADLETIESIRLQAPMMFEAQNRSVTAQDYKNIIGTKILPSAAAIAVWGAEELLETDPFYRGLGYVFISILPTKNEETYLDVDTKEFIQTELREKYATVTIFPEIVSPNFVYISVNTRVKYDKTKNVPQDLATTIKTNILNDQRANYSSFQTTMRYSKLSTIVDDSSENIISNELTVNLFVRKVSVADISTGFNFGTAISVGSILSTNFLCIYDPANPALRRTVFIAEDGNGKISLKYLDSNGNAQVQVGNIGTVNYSTGLITLNSLFNMSNIDQTSITYDNPMKLYASTFEKDIEFSKNMAPILKTEDISVEMIPQ